MERGNENCSTARAPTLGAVSPGLSGADQSPVRPGEATVTDILTNDEISLLRKFGEKVPHHRREFHSQALRPLGDERLYQVLIANPEHAGHAVRDNHAGKAALRAAGGAAD